MKYCSKCGQGNDDECRFCSKCGAAFYGSDSQYEKKTVQTSYHWGPGEIFLGILGVGGVIGLIWLFTVIG